MFKNLVIDGLLSLLIAAGACSAEPSETWQHSYHFPHGSVGPLALHNGYAYVLNGWTRGDGVLVFDVRNPEKPRFVDGMCARGYLVDLEFKDDILFAAARFSLMVINVSDPTECRLVRNLLLGFPQMEVERLALSGDGLFVGGRGSGLRIYDVSEPDSPDLLSHQPEFGYVNQLHATDELALIKPRTTKARLGTVGKEGFVTRAELDGRGPFLFANGSLVESATTGLSILDVSDPENPSVVTNLVGLRAVTSLRRNRLLARNANSLAIVDMRDTSSPRIERTVRLPADTDILRIDAEKTTCAVLDRTRTSLRLFDIRGEEAKVLGESFMMRNEGTVEIGDGVAYVCSAEDTTTVLLPLDLSRPGFTDFASRLAFPPVDKANAFKTHDVVRAAGCARIGNYLLVGDGLVSIADPQRPEIIRPMTRPAAAIVVREGLAYLAQSDRLTVLDVSSLPDLSVKAVYKPEGDKNHIVGVAPAGGHAFVVNRTRVETVSINPVSGTTKLLGSCDVHPAVSCALKGDVLYVPSASWGQEDSLALVDVSDPATPTVVRRLDGLVENGCRRIRCHGDRLVFTDNMLGVKVADIHDPLNPVPADTFIGQTDVGNTFNDFSIVGDKLYALRHSQLDVWTWSGAASDTAGTGSRSAPSAETLTQRD